MIEGRIGEGGMGAVYLAVDQKFGSRVAIKETFYGDTEYADAFEREARLLNGLHHPIFPHVSDHFTENGGHFLVMEYIEGEDLSEILKRGETFSAKDVMRWTLDLLDGLDYLHSQDPPIIHRDIKPNNLKLTSRGNIVLLDFGMAKETSGNTLGMKSVFGYSRRYSPLEQIEGTGTDVRADIFSLGATVFHLLTGKPPIDVLARASAIVRGRPDPLQPADALNKDVPETIAAIISSALALNADQRFASARAMRNAVEFALNSDLGMSESAVDDVSVPADTELAEHLPAVIPVDTFPALQAFKADALPEIQALKADSENLPTESRNDTFTLANAAGSDSSGDYNPLPWNSVLQSFQADIEQKAPETGRNETVFPDSISYEWIPAESGAVPWVADLQALKDDVGLTETGVTSQQAIAAEPVRPEITHQEAKVEELEPEVIHRDVEVETVKFEVTEPDAQVEPVKPKVTHLGTLDIDGDIPQAPFAEWGTEPAVPDRHYDDYTKPVKPALIQQAQIEPVNRKVIHLGTIDVEDDIPDVPPSEDRMVPTGLSIDPAKQGILVRPRVRTMPANVRIRKPIQRRSAIWLPVVLAGLAFLGYGIYNAQSADETAQAAPADQTVAAPAEVPAEVSGDSQQVTSALNNVPEETVVSQTANSEPPVADEVAMDEVVANNSAANEPTAEVSAIGELPSIESEPLPEYETVAKSKAMPSRYRTRAGIRVSRIKEYNDASQPLKTDTREIAKTPVRTVNPAPRQQNTLTVRPRIVPNAPPFKQPSVSRIETILTGFPDQRKRQNTNANTPPRRVGRSTTGGNRRQ